MKRKTMIELDTQPVWIRIPLFVILTPILLVLVAMGSVVASVAIVIGTFVIMCEFLIYGGIKTDKEFDETERSDEKKNLIGVVEPETIKEDGENAKDL